MPESAGRENAPAVDMPPVMGYPVSVAGAYTTDNLCTSRFRDHGLLLSYARQ